MKAKIIGLAAATGLAAALVAAPAAQAVPGTGLTPAVIDNYLTKAMDNTGLPGLSAVVTHGDRIVHAVGFGEDSAGRPVTEDTPMRVASVSKSFTAMAVMTLVDEGRIKLDEPVADQLPEFVMVDPRARAVTVRQLLNQTSGFSDTTIDIGTLKKATSLADYVSRLRTASLAADPGTRFGYCNVNYDLAARLVEVASGRSFGDYLKQRIFDPLGMTGSGVSASDIRPADGYNSVFGAWVPRPELPGFLDNGGSGGVVTTAADLGKWLVTQTGNGTQLVTADSLRTMHAPSEVGDYGMGWGSETGPGGTTRLVHSGNLFTYTAVQAIVPETGYGFAIMTNSAALHDDTVDILNDLMALSQGQTPAEPGGGRQMFELVLGLIALAAVGIGALGVLRSARWATKRAGRPFWRVVPRLLPVLLPVAVLIAYPDLISLLTGGRTVTWAQLTYFAIPLTITVFLMAAAGALVTVMRLVRLRVGRSVR